ncbi:MAG: hypothetical protein AAGG81_05855 [Chlamydiota bacterium]
MKTGSISGETKAEKFYNDLSAVVHQTDYQKHPWLIANVGLAGVINLISKLQSRGSVPLQRQRHGIAVSKKVY